MVTREMVEGRGLQRSEVAVRMETAPAAVTQYMKGVRGKRSTERFEDSSAMMKIVGEIVDELAKAKVSPLKVVSKLCAACGVAARERMMPEMSEQSRKLILACKWRSPRPTTT